MSIKFITFGSHDNYIKAGERLLEQANKINIFTETLLYTPEFLKNDVDFWNQHGEFIHKNNRGYGYWLWKPFIIKKTMEKMSNGDILLYLDCGCELGSSRKNELLKCIDVVKTDKIVGTTVSVEGDWNKMDLIDKLDMNKPEYLITAQRQGGTNLFLVCDETRNLVNEWYKLGCDYHNIDDSPSNIKNLDGFKEHRHDQSIFSLLTKKYNLFSKHSLKNAIYCIRNRSGTSNVQD
jgi:hypothetical protein